MQSTKEWQQSSSKAALYSDQVSIEVSITLKNGPCVRTPISEEQQSLLCATIVDALNRVRIANNSLSAPELSALVTSLLKEQR